MSMYGFMNKEEYEHRPWQNRTKYMTCQKYVTNLKDMKKTSRLVKNKLANTKLIGGE